MRLDDTALDLIFGAARTHSHWLEQSVDEALLRQAYDLAKMAPTSANCSPMRIVFVRSVEAKARLAPALSAGNRDKTMKAPITAILAQDMVFYEKLPRLFRQADARSWFAGNAQKIEETAFRNSSLQAAYFILACRSLGLDCGPMSGFDNKKLDAAFFPDGRWKSNFLCNLGYGDASHLHPRNERLAFDEACQVL